MSASRAAIALFLYKRPEHARRVIAALRDNAIACESDLYVFCDGPKGEADRDAVNDVRTLATTISGFNSVTVTSAPINRGIARSIIAGVSHVFGVHDRAVIVEDDIVLSPNALGYFNAMLDYFEPFARVASISGNGYAPHLVPIPPRFPYDVYFTPRLNCWGWATWRNRWTAVDWDASDGDAVLADPRAAAAFARGGNDLPELWRLYRTGRIDSWAIRWTYHQFRHGTLTVHPRSSYARCIGLDGSGIHGGVDAISSQTAPSSAARAWRLPSDVKLDRRILWAHKDLHDRTMAGGSRRRWLSLPVWWTRFARYRRRFDLA